MAGMMDVVEKVATSVAMPRSRAGCVGIAAALLGATLLAGCGQKGPLTLPKTAPAASSPT
jgi:Prokaryotic lipoprotein-attachment site